MNSMTGFGGASAESGGREMTVELKSVNHRFLDIGMRLPRALGFLEDQVRKALQVKLSRGHVDVYINYRNNGEDANAVELNEGLLLGYAKARARAAQLTGYADDAGVSPLLSLPDVVTVRRGEEDADAVNALCAQAVDRAADALIAMRKAEGAELAADLSGRVDALEKLTDVIEENAAGVAKEYGERLRSRISEWLDTAPVDENRLAGEIALFADKASIAEETVRLRSHFTQLRSMLRLDGPVGRKLDFLVQEINREFNTVGSKANSLPITNAVMEAKGEVEKMREQVQNIE